MLNLLVSRLQIYGKKHYWQIEHEKKTAPCGMALKKVPVGQSSDISWHILHRIDHQKTGSKLGPVFYVL